ncbi:MAG: ATP-binding protein [Halanaerobium sp.]
MHYKNIYIRDFGIFNNQNLNSLSKNLVVVGGKNRAGKSTFLKLLRYLPYGLPQDNSIPPAKNQYYIEAQLKRENENYNLFLEGFAAPRVFDQAKNKLPAAELFNNLDQMSYQQLFTISLDELQQLSKIAKGKKQRKRLFSILLGAGMSELVKVPEIADKYLNQAKNIGGLLGDPAVASFKPYFNEIKEAEELRDRALLEIKDFNRKREKLKESQAELKETRIKITDCEYKYILLDLLKNNYSTLEEIKKLEIELKNAVFNNQDYNDQEILPEQKLDNKLNDFLEFIDSQSQKIKKFKQKEDFLKEKIENYYSQKNKINNNYQLLIADLEEINSQWSEPLKSLKEIELDLIKEQELKQNLGNFSDLNSEIKDIRENIKGLKFDIEENKSDLAELNFRTPSAVLKNSYLILAFSLLILASSFFINYSQLIYLSLISALAGYIYYSSNYKSSKIMMEKEDELKNNIQVKEKKLKTLNSELAEKKEELTKIKSSLNNYAQMLGLNLEGNFSFLNHYLREIRDKKRKYNNLKIEEKENEQQKNNLEIELEAILDLIKSSAEYLNVNFNSNHSDKNQLISKSDNIIQDLNLLYELEETAAAYKNYKSKLKYILNATEKTESALKTINQDKNKYYQSFINFYQKFSNPEKVEKEKKLIFEKLNSLKKKKENLEEKITTLNNEVKELASSTKIEKSQHKINQAQNNLEKKAQRYAVNKSVYLVLKKLRSRMIAKAEKELLKPASEILAKISSEYYQELKTTAELEKTDFKTITGDGKKVESVKNMSQGSLEQLFLAVRISRIKEIKPALPIILDDSLVNFDREHLYNTAEIISNLAEEHQIFILSCHPHLISYISSISNSAQYWKLEAGSFSLSNQEELISHLNL